LNSDCREYIQSNHQKDLDFVISFERCYLA